MTPTIKLTALKYCKNKYKCDQLLEEKTYFRSSQTGQMYPIKQNISCFSSDVIYIINLHVIYNMLDRQVVNFL